MDILQKQFGISEKWLETLKPFYCLIDENYNIVCSGNALSKVIKEDTNIRLIDLFDSNKNISSFNEIEKLKGELIILKSKFYPISIYGSIELSDDRKNALFIMSMKVGDIDSFEALNLSLNDFPTSDTTVDYMISLQAAKATMMDNKALINKLKKEKSKINKGHSKLEQLVNSVDVSILEIEFPKLELDYWDKFLDAKILARNNEAAKLFKIPKLEDIDLKLKDILGFVLKEEFEGLSDVLNGSLEKKTFEVKLPLTPYKTLHTMMTLSIKEEDDHEVSYLTIVDISKQKALTKAFYELKDTQNQLVQAGKLATLGTMAGIAHELSNPLAAVKGFCQILHSRNKQTELDNIFSKTLKSIDRMETVVHHLRKLSRKTSNDEKEIFDIRESINDAFNTFEQPLHKLNINVEFTFPASKTLIFAHKPDMDTVFSNLFSNSIDAYKELAKSRSKTIKIAIKKDGPQISIIYIDNAMGIPKEIVERVFDPFFTTKKAADGTGIGLNLVKNIIKSVNGSIEVNSTVGEGSRFDIALSSANEFMPSITNASKSGSNLISEKRSILIVDDEPDICDLLEQSLNDDFDVQTALTANSAMQFIHAKKHDCILLDYRMPDSTEFN